MRVTLRIEFDLPIDEDPSRLPSNVYLNRDESLRALAVVRENAERWQNEHAAGVQQ